MWRSGCAEERNTHFHRAAQGNAMGSRPGRMEHRPSEDSGTQARTPGRSVAQVLKSDREQEALSIVFTGGNL